MEVIREYNQVNPNYERAVALGNFDGVHLGHQELIRTLLDKSRNRKIQSCVYTFRNHTIPIISNITQVQYITNLKVKKTIFKNLGINMLFLDEFNEKLMRLKPQEFVENILVKVFNCKELIVGFDYRFGYNAQGDISLLEELGKIYGFCITVLDAVMLDNQKVSSSNIKRYLMDGNIQKTNELLGRYFLLQGRIITGHARGRDLGYPTANIEIDPLQVIPGPGVYATMVEIDGRMHMGGTSIGTKPTFGSHDESIETFIMDYNDNIYGKVIKLYFIEKIRNEIKFASAKELISQISIDVKDIKKHLQSNLNVLK